MNIKEEQGHQANQTNRERILDLIENINLAAGIDFGVRLEIAGLLVPLEKMGVLNTVEDPNPYDPERDLEKHEQWWDAHPGEGDKFSVDLERRMEALKLLYIGAIMGRFLPEIFRRSDNRTG